MKILIDSNPIYGDYLLEGAPFETLARYLSWTDDELIIPIIVIEESIRHFMEKYEETLGKIITSSNLVRIVDAELDELPDIDDAEMIYRTKLLNRLSELDARIIEIPEVKVAELLERDLHTRRPFDRSGRGFRDTLIWESILRECFGHDETVIIITADGDFEQDSRDRNVPPKLHEDLESDLIKLGFEKDRVKLIRHIHEFNEENATPLISRVYRKGDSIEDSFAKVLDPQFMLDQYGEAAAREVHEQLFFILPIGRSLADRVSFIRWPEDPQLIEALDLGGGRLQAIIRTHIVFDTDIYGPEETISKLMEFSKGRSVIVMNINWDKKNKDYVINLRVAILADFIFHWHPDENRASAFTLLRYGFTEEEIEQSPMFLH